MTKNRNYFIYISIIFIFTLIGWFARDLYRLIVSPQTPKPLTPILKPLAKYSIESLRSTSFPSSNITIEKTIKETDTFTSYLFSFTAENKKITGLINIPTGTGPFPVVVMFRGYVDQKIYQTGIGTNRAGEYFAENGFITVAPDFLGYGGSDKEAENIFESRFQTYTTALTLISSVKNIKEWDRKNLFIWGHSNGGQIALTILETTQKEYPTVLWAPVSKPFPYSILYYTDESDDHGKLIRQELAKFEENYDVEKYSLTNYLDSITAPVSLHQGTNDDAVPKTWSDTLSKKINNVEYRTYLGADHNLVPSWSEAVRSSLLFYQKHLLD